MVTLSPELETMTFGRRHIRFFLACGRIENQMVGDQQQQVLRNKAGEYSTIHPDKWQIEHNDNDFIVRLMVARNQKDPGHLACVINCTARERQQAQPLSTLLHNTRVSRSVNWWWSVLFLVFAAIIIETGIGAREIASVIEPSWTQVSDTLNSLLSPLFAPLLSLFDGLAWPDLTDSLNKSGAFGQMSVQWPFMVSGAVLALMIISLRSFRIFTVPLFAACLFMLKIRLFGYNDAQGQILTYFSWLIGALVVVGLINRVRDRIRLAVRLDKIGKSMLSNAVCIKDQEYIPDNAPIKVPASALAAEPKEKSNAPAQTRNGTTNGQNKPIAPPARVSPADTHPAPPPPSA